MADSRTFGRIAAPPEHFYVSHPPGGLQTLLPGAVPAMIQAALQALVPNAVPGVFPGVAPSALLTSGTLLDAHPVVVPGMSTGELSVISPTEVLPPTTESTPSTVTIKVIVRHSKACKKERPGLGKDCEDCDCRKSLYIYENGKDRIISARTRSWKKAEQMAKAETDKRDPLKQRLIEIERIVAAGMTAMFTAQAASSMSIEEATVLWLKTKAKEVRAKGSLRTHKSVADRIRGWAEAHNIQTVAEFTRIRLDEWRGEWGPNAVEPYNKMKQTTQSQFQSYFVGFLDYMVDAGSIEKNPVASWKGIPVDCDPPPASESRAVQRRAQRSRAVLLVPARLLEQDGSGVPCAVSLAALGRIADTRCPCIAQERLGREPAEFGYDQDGRGHQWASGAGRSRRGVGSSLTGPEWLQKALLLLARGDRAGFADLNLDQEHQRNECLSSSRRRGWEAVCI
jgi:hypothetical protein